MFEERVAKGTKHTKGVSRGKIDVFGKGGKLTNSFNNSGRKLSEGWMKCTGYSYPFQSG
jgi:hypothetical protein